MKVFSIFIVTCFLAVGCGKEYATPEELRAYVNDPAHGLLQVKSIRDLDVTAFYKPTELVALQIATGVNEEHFDSVSNVIKNQMYVILQLSKNGKEIESAYSAHGNYQDIIQYLSYGVREKISATIGDVNLPLIDLIYDPHFGTTNATSLMAVFDMTEASRTKTEGNLNVILADDQLGMGTINFSFESNDLKNIPQLKVN